ncbi:hypothetical protein N9L68_03155 [bacterium]|nr:hypothetical protein [bacterium]
MPCAMCGEWARGFRWFSELRMGPDQLPAGPCPRWRYWYQDPADPCLYWTIQCSPTCAANRLPAKLNEAERVLLNGASDRAMRETILREFRGLKEAAVTALEELSDAWSVLDG